MKKLALLAGLAVVACGPKHEVENRATPAAISPVTCIAVLPFENLSADPAAGEGMADVIATELLKSGRFQVMDRAESARILASRGIYLPATTDAGQIRALGDVLGVQAVMMGSVSEWAYRSSSFGDRPDRPVIGVSTRLVDVRTSTTLWGARFAGSPAGFMDAATPPMTVASQRVAADITGGLIADAGNVNPPDKPCWDAKAQSVLATLAPGAGGGPSRTTPTPAATAVAMATPTPAATVVAMATPEPTVAPTPVPIKLTASQTSLRDKLKAGATFQLEGVAFDGMTTNLAATSNAVVGDLGAVLVAHPELRLRIEAHVDPTDPGPVPLSQKRAEAMVAKLVSIGANAGQLEPKGMGGSKSLFPSFVEAMKAKNRRVEVVVVAPPSAGGAVASASPTPAGTPVGGNARVKVLASKGAQANAVKLANSLKQTGTNVITIASVPEARAKTLVYYVPKFKTQATSVAKAIKVPGGARLAASPTLKGVDIVVLVGTDLK